MGLGVEGVLDVALAHDAQVADDLDGGVAQHVVLVVVERLAGSHHDGFSRVDAQRVDVLHVAHLSEETRNRSRGHLVGFDITGLLLFFLLLL